MSLVPTTAWTRQMSVLIVSVLFVITSPRALPQKSGFMLPILLLPNVNPSRTPSPEQHHFQNISRCLAADGPSMCILNENYHTRSAGGWREAHYWVWKKSRTSSTTHWIKATLLCITIFQASSHTATFHLFQQFTSGKWKYMMDVQNQIKLLDQNHPCLDIYPKTD